MLTIGEVARRSASRLSLDEIRGELAKLPADRVPSPRDRSRLSRASSAQIAPGGR
jgi:hypothetical protein